MHKTCIFSNILLLTLSSHIYCTKWIYAYICICISNNIIVGIYSIIYSSFFFICNQVVNISCQMTTTRSQCSSSLESSTWTRMGTFHSRSSRRSKAYSAYQMRFIRPPSSCSIRMEMDLLLLVCSLLMTLSERFTHSFPLIIIINFYPKISAKKKFFNEGMRYCVNKIEFKKFSKL